MGLKTYMAGRRRFTWRNRHADDDNTLAKVLGECKNQDIFGRGKCAYVGTTGALEAHWVIKSKPSQRRHLSPVDLENKVHALRKANKDTIGLTLMKAVFLVLSNEGVAFEDSEEVCKIKNYRGHDMKTRGHAGCAVHHYLRHGPMMGVFPVRGGEVDTYGRRTRMDLDLFGDTPDLDAILFLSNSSAIQQIAHLVTITGFGLQSLCPFWEFQNTYGPEWRGPARGYGQLYALHLTELYGFELV